MGHLKNYHVGFPNFSHYNSIEHMKISFPQFLSIGLFDLIFVSRQMGFCFSCISDLFPFGALILGPSEAVLSGDGLHHAKLLTIHPTVRKHIPPPPAGSSSSATQRSILLPTFLHVFQPFDTKRQRESPPLSSRNKPSLHWALEGSPGPSLGARSCPGAGCPPPHPSAFWAEPSLMGKPGAVGKFLLTEAKMLIQNFK